MASATCRQVRAASALVLALVGGREDQRVAGRKLLADDLALGVGVRRPREAVATDDGVGVLHHRRVVEQGVDHVERAPLVARRTGAAAATKLLLDMTAKGGAAAATAAIAGLAAAAPAEAEPALMKLLADASADRRRLAESSPSMQRSANSVMDVERIRTDSRTLRAITGMAVLSSKAPDAPAQATAASLPTTCPDCAGPVLEDAVHVQYQEDIPRPVPTTVTQFNVHIGHCAQCQRRIQGRHPDQTSDALGAAAIQIGPNALGLAAEMKHGLGVSYGKVARLLETSLGLRLGRSTVAVSYTHLTLPTSDLV